MKAVFLVTYIKKQPAASGDGGWTAGGWSQTITEDAEVLCLLHGHNMLSVFLS